MMNLFFVFSHLYGINLKFQFEIRHPVAIQYAYVSVCLCLNGNQHRAEAKQRSASRLIIILLLDPRQNSRALNDAASILKDCGLDNVCIPDLKMATHMSNDKYLIGSEDKLELSMNITNDGKKAIQGYQKLAAHCF